MLDKIGYKILKDLPRGSVIFAKDHFKNKEIVCAEIGVLHGYNSLSILNELNVKKLYLIDPYVTYFEKANGDKYKVKVEGSESIMKKRLLVFSEVKHIKKCSLKAIKDLPDKLDFVYLDGNHSLNHLQKELKLYWDKIAEGGILA